MKLMICTVFNCFIACASTSNVVENCEWPSPNRSPTPNSGVLLTDIVPTRPSTTHHNAPAPQPVLCSAEETMPGIQPDDIPHSPPKVSEPDQNQNLVWNFFTNYKFVIPCVSAISYVAYRCLKK